MAQREVQMLTNRLGLNAQQAAQATTIFTNQFTADAATHASMKTERTALATAIQTPNSGNTIQTIANQIGTLTAQLTVSDATARAAFYAILTPAQQTTYNQHPGFGAAGPRGFGRGGPR